MVRFVKSDGSQYKLAPTLVFITGGVTTVTIGFSTFFFGRIIRFIGNEAAIAAIIRRGRTLYLFKKYVYIIINFIQI